MTAVNRSPDAVFDRHLAAWEARQPAPEGWGQRVETAARAAFDFAEQEDWPEDQRATWDELWPNARSFWRRLAAAALTADAETRDGDDGAVRRVRIIDEAAEACLAVFESIPLLRDATVATELRASLREYDKRVGQCDGECHERDEDDCPRCCSGRELQVCDDCMAASR